MFLWVLFGVICMPIFRKYFFSKEKDYQEPKRPKTGIKSVFLPFEFILAR